MMENVYDLSGRHLTLEEVSFVLNKRCEDLGVKVLSVVPKSIKNSDIIFICSNCGKESTRKSDAIILYKTTECKKCSNSRKQGKYKRANITKESLQIIISDKYKEKNINFEIIEDFVYENNKQLINIKCVVCDNICASRIDLLTQGRKSCKCIQIRSKLESMVKKILEKNNLIFEKEYGFNDLRHIQPLRYDFGVFVYDKILLIECDGIQHFYPTFGALSFDRTQTTDKIKNNYAKEKNIPLLRIPYNTKESIEEMILKFINS